MENLNELFDKIQETTIKLQRHYFDNERFFDNISGAESLDNATGWTEDLIYILNGFITGAKAIEGIDWLIKAFADMQYKMECHGAGANGAARGINHNTQYAWALLGIGKNLTKQFKSLYIKQNNL